MPGTAKTMVPCEQPFRSRSVDLNTNAFSMRLMPRLHLSTHNEKSLQN